MDSSPVDFVELVTAPNPDGNDILSRLECPICFRVVVLNPVETTCCSKLVCEKCEGQNRASHTDFPKCFNCRKGNYKVQGNGFIRQFIDDMQVRCKLCKKTMSHERLMTHVDENAELAGENACAELDRPCPNAVNGCEFKGKLAALRKHLAEECNHGLREFDEEAKRLCGGEERIKHNIELIKSVLGLGGGSGAGCPPERPRLFQERLQAAQVYILVADYHRLVGRVENAVSAGSKLYALHQKNFTPDSDPETITSMLTEYASILRHRVVDTWNFKAVEDRPSRSYFEREGVKRPTSEFLLQMSMSSWYDLFYESLPAEKPKPRPPSPPPDTRPLCRNFRRGRCHYGRNCRYRHS